MRHLARLVAAALLLPSVTCSSAPRGIPQVCDPTGRADIHAFLEEHRGAISPGEVRRLLKQHDLRHEDARQVLPLLGIEPGWTVVDLGCGMGHFTFSMAREVGPRGRIHALDINPGYLQLLEHRMADPVLNPHRNVLPRRSKPERLGLPAQSADMLLMAHLDFHAFAPLETRHERLLASAVETVKPGGRVVVLQFMNLVGPGFAVSDPANTRANLQALGLVERDAVYFEDYGSWLFTFVKHPS
jgi:SAM-dependent methyltransferase